MIGELKRDIFALPSPTARLMEYSMFRVSIPESRGVILSLIKSMAVRSPASKPPIKATIIARTGLTPILLSTANINAPKGKEPSTERSAISNTLYEI